MKPLPSIKLLFVFLLLAIPVAFQACTSGPRPIQFGTDNCDFCKMTISDERYGAELLSQKGRIYLFDDLHCIKEFIQKETVPREQIKAVYLIDFARPGVLIPATDARLLHHEELKSPMGANIAVFGNSDSFTLYQATYSGTAISWEDYLK